MRLKIAIFCLMIILAAATGAEETPSGESILKQVDENFGSSNKIILSEMVIHGRRGRRTIKSKSWIQGTTKSFTEYLAPAREKGTKMLKLEDQMWTYFPATDRTIRISGHMLRQSVMGSDLSYEDMMEDPELLNLYTAEVVDEETLLERSCWVLKLVSRRGDVAYHSRKVWVDKERFVSLREERYAKSGKLLKTTEVLEVTKTSERWVPKHIVFKDVLKAGKGTEFILESVEFDATIPAYTFSKASLR